MIVAKFFLIAVLAIVSAAIVLAVVDTVTQLKQ
jgi:hypothetical protein